MYTASSSAFNGCCGQMCPCGAAGGGSVEVWRWSPGGGGWRLGSVSWVEVEAA